MGGLYYRVAGCDDVPALAEIRGGDWGNEEFWCPRILSYLNREHQPREALAARESFLCADGKLIVGFVAGHLTRRFRCDGEVQWISVRPSHRNRGIAIYLLRLMSEWFVSQNARRICVNVDPANDAARRFYARSGAIELKPYWMIWKDIGSVLELNRDT